MLDLIIVGGGPAGLNAALYAARAGLDAVLFEKMFAGGQMMTTTTFENYIGFPNGVAAVDLALNMEEQAKNAGAKILYEEIESVELGGKVKKVKTAGGEYEAKTVILCTGAEPRTLGVDGEDRLRGMGVSYCATCDGAFFKGKEVAVVGGGDTALEDALFLSRYCNKIYLIHRRESFRGAKVLENKVRETANIELVLDTVVEKIEGEDTVTAVLMRNVKTDECKELNVDGVFVAVGTKPNTELFDGQLELDGGYVAAGEDAVTSLPGVYAAGDVRKKPLRQVITAAADGAVAVYSATKYLDTEF